MPTPPVGSVEDFANYLTTGYWLDSGGFAHDFATGTGTTTLTVNLAGLDATGRQLARWAMEAWESVANIDFVETTGTAQITFDDAQSGAITSVRFNSRLELVSATVNIGTAFTRDNGSTIDSYSMYTYMHELGHALGLGHAGNYDGGTANYDTSATFANDSWLMTVMSYFSQNANPTIEASQAVAVTPMIADIIAIQQLYGAPGANANAGNTIYGVGGNLEGYFGDLLDMLIAGTTGGIRNGRPFSFTLYDEEGVDTINFSHDTRAQIVDLAPGSLSNVFGFRQIMQIALGTVIESFTAGRGHDRVSGNHVANTLAGGLGNDTLYGREGNDRLYGGDGADILHGDDGHDRLEGGEGGDSLYGGNGADSLSGEGGNDVLFGGTGVDSLYGGEGHDSLNGMDGNDLLYGGEGHDTLYGMAGTDSLFGGEGNDTILGQGGSDYIEGGGGNDILNGDASHDTLYGGEGHDSLYGGAGIDLLSGDEGNDFLAGGDGGDSLYGGAGNDTLNGMNANDVLFGGEGNDILYGLAGTDSLFGGDGHDTLIGHGGADYLDGGAGNDRLQGGNAQDTFVFRPGYDADVIVGFHIVQDRLLFDAALVDTPPGGSPTAADFLTMASVVNGNVVFDFGGGDTLTLLGVTALSRLDPLIDLL